MDGAGKPWSNVATSMAGCSGAEVAAASATNDAGRHAAMIRHVERVETGLRRDDPSLRS